jgi:uncharacterized membrane protein
VETQLTRMSAEPFITAVPSFLVLDSEGRGTHRLMGFSKVLVMSSLASTPSFIAKLKSGVLKLTITESVSPYTTSASCSYLRYPR